jgi:heme-degrading monooxygenase HmoA
VFLRVWQYDVWPAHVAAFEAAYGPGGTWARLFRLAHGYAGTELYRGVGSPTRFLSVDRWHSEADWHRFLADHEAAYRDRDEDCAELTRSEAELWAGSWQADVSDPEDRAPVGSTVTQPAER